MTDERRQSWGAALRAAFLPVQPDELERSVLAIETQANGIVQAVERRAGVCFTDPVAGMVDGLFVDGA